MGADMIVGWECDAKLKLGDGGALAGTVRLLELIRSRNRAEAAIEASGGKPAAEVEFLMVLNGPDGPRETTFSAAALLEEAAALDALAPGCDGCPANVLGKGFGCVTYLRYPISLATETALLERLEPADHLGGHVCLSAIESFDYHGRDLAAWRARGLIESPTAPTRDLGDGAVVSMDSIWHGILGVGGEVGAFHALLVLMWFGALLIDGELPDDVEDPFDILSDPEARLERLGLRRIEEPSARLLFAVLFRCGALDVPLLLDA